jgi:hypothetical protein
MGHKGEIPRQIKQRKYKHKRAKGLENKEKKKPKKKRGSPLVRRKYPVETKFQWKRGNQRRIKKLWSRSVSRVPP